MCGNFSSCGSETHRNQQRGSDPSIELIQGKFRENHWIKITAAKGRLKPGKFQISANLDTPGLLSGNLRAFSSGGFCHEMSNNSFTFP